MTLLCGVGSARAQHVTATESEQPDGSLRVSMQIDWARSLAAQVDSLGMSTVSAADYERLGGGLLEADALVRLNGPSASARLVSSDYDELAVPGEPSSGSPQIVGIGQMRREWVGTLSVPVFGHEDGMLRRYRRLVVDVQRPQAPSARVVGAQDNPHLAVTRSVFADGSIYRISVTEEGIYRIDRALISAIGLNPDAVEPNQIHIYGNGGRPLPAVNGAERYADLVENRVFVRGGGDGRFDSGDVLLFYGAAPRGWTDESGQWSHFVHPFSNDNAYFLKIDNTPGARVAPASFPGLTGVPVLTQVTGRYVTDIEEQVWSREHGSGQDWMSNAIRVGGRRDILQALVLPNLLAGTVQYHARTAIASNPRATVSFESGSTVLAQQTAQSIIIAGAEFPSASAAETQFSQSVAAGAPLNLSMRLLNQINEPAAAVDWVRVYYPQALQANAGLLRLATPIETTGSMELRLAGFASAPQVWDVTRPDDVHAVGAQVDGSAYRVQVTRPADQAPRELIAFTEAAARTLETARVTPVSNQNLHGVTIYPDLVIVAPADFLEAAEELAELRRAEGLGVVVVRVADIYREFSGGQPDMRAIRDYLKFIYDRAPSADQLLRFGLLFGDGHFNFRGINQAEGTLKNWVFPFETEESLISDATFTSDDYFGLLDDIEGAWTYTTFTAVSSERMDIGIGRLPVQSLAQARMVVDKIRRYERPDNAGPWRTLYTFVADDGPTGLSGQQDDVDLHVQNIDQVAELLRTGLYPEINPRKIYAESYERVFQNGFRIPGAKAAFNDAINTGTLLINYSGHGGPDGLAQEEIFTRQDAEALYNRDKLAIFVTATCSFGWWDLVDEQSGAEALLLNANGGAVALMTTVRLVYTSGDTTSLNAGLNRALNIELFRPDPDGGARRLGDAMLYTKNTRVGLQGNSRKFNLLGDPSMRVGLAKGRVELQTLNGEPLSGGTGQMRALDRVTISGMAYEGDGAPLEGLVHITVFDATRQVPLLRQLRMPTPYYNIREDLIWRGDVKTQSGQFTATFVVPKDISYSNLAGRISAYGTSANGQSVGYSESFIVGGTSANPPDDREGPQMSLFLNDTTFVAGSAVPADPDLIVQLFDESGINTVGAGVGHELLLVVDEDESGAVDISSGFLAAENSYQKGGVQWPLSIDTPGPHTISVRAWDVLNNSSSGELSFIVAEDSDLELRNVYNYPNPMSRETRFVFEHNQPPGTAANVEIRVYTLNGLPVRTIRTEEALPDGVLNSGPVQILWDGRDDDLDRLATGIYLYRVRVEAERSDGARQVSERIEKLAVIR